MQLFSDITLDRLFVRNRNKVEDEKLVDRDVARAFSEESVGNYTVVSID